MSESKIHLEKTRCPVCGKFVTASVNTTGMIIIDEEQVPKSKTGEKTASLYDKIFEKIPEGKALVVPSSSVKYDSLWHALKRWQSKGKFLNFRIVKRKVEGNITSYVINPEKGKVK